MTKEEYKEWINSTKLSDFEKQKLCINLDKIIEPKINPLFDERINFGMWLTGLDRDSVIELYKEYLNKPSIFDGIKK